ncbi:uncharacterized protein LOC131055859 [Cryptomeria japonica]|uniref:uncharacterized protein LOC131055859 n=1 Tax=Cryptomeria japonica TaxID=3369 RepID=UPI0027DA9513|nr:uncharacterized protein LOC131055859 [Cryptomeria japonica]
MTKGFFSFAFSCEEDLSDVLYGGPWVVGKTSLALNRWSPNLYLNDGIFGSAPIWVRLPGFPLEFWQEDVFKGLASSFGELLFVDSMTTARKRMVYARIYINRVVSPPKMNFGNNNGLHKKIWREKMSKVAQNEDGSIEMVKDIGNLKESDSSSPVQLEQDGDIDVIKTTSQARQEESTDTVKGNSEDGSGETEHFVKDGCMPNPFVQQLEEGEIDARLNDARVAFSSPKSMEKEDQNEVVNCMCSQSEENVKSTYPAKERSPLPQNLLEEKRSESSGGSGPLKLGKENHLMTQEAMRGEAPFIQVEKKKSKKAGQTVGAPHVGVSTRQKHKVDTSKPNTTPGRKSNKRLREQECRHNLADGS